MVIFTSQPPYHLQMHVEKEAQNKELGEYTLCDNLEGRMR
jgi:hypothetical protein